MPIRAIIFDFDGVILDTESTDFLSWQEMFAAHGCELRMEVWADCIGRPYGYFDPFAHLEQLSGFGLDRELLRVQRHARLMELNLLQDLQPGVLAYLMDARNAGLKIGLASSSDRAWVHGHLERLRVLEFFTTMRCFEDTGTHKPDPGPYLAVLEALEIRPTEAIAFEDSPNGDHSSKGGRDFLCGRAKSHYTTAPLRACGLSAGVIRGAAAAFAYIAAGARRSAYFTPRAAEAATALRKATTSGCCSCRFEGSWGRKSVAAKNRWSARSTIRTSPASSTPAATNL
jgi:HAD superfamily hydrolase (TIGR01509 family)